MDKTINLTISIPTKKEQKYLGKIQVTRAELTKHKHQRIALVLNRLTEYMLNNAKKDDVIIDYMNNIHLVKYVTDDGLVINLLEE